MKQVLQLAWQDRLVATPDCDLGFLGLEQQRQSFVPFERPSGKPARTAQAWLPCRASDPVAFGLLSETFPTGNVHET